MLHKIFNVRRCVRAFKELIMCFPCLIGRKQSQYAPRCISMFIAFIYRYKVHSVVTPRKKNSLIREMSITNTSKNKTSEDVAARAR